MENNDSITKQGKCSKCNKVGEVIASKFGSKEYWCLKCTTIKRSCVSCLKIGLCLLGDWPIIENGKYTREQKESYWCEECVENYGIYLKLNLARIEQELDQDKSIKEEINKATETMCCFFCKQKKDKKDYTTSFIIEGQPVCLNCEKKLN